jgi:ATP-dependent Clp protease ATP-binding subunit ClpX
LTIEDLLKILTQTEENMVGQYKELFKFYNSNLDFDEDSLQTIAKHAKSLKTGARSLKTIMETVLLDSMFELGDAIITKDYVEQKIQSQLPKQ